MRGKLQAVASYIGDPMEHTQFKATWGLDETEEWVGTGNCMGKQIRCKQAERLEGPAGDPVGSRPQAAYGGDCNWKRRSVSGGLRLRLLLLWGSAR